MKKQNWVWMPHSGHLIVGNQCIFHLNTYVNGYIVSTVGEWWPERSVREIHAQVYDSVWFKENKQRMGDDFNHAYMQRFGFEEIGLNRKYETMVFKAKKDKSHPCCPYTASDWSNIDFDSYNDPNYAFAGHMKMCKKWSRL